MRGNNVLYEQPEPRQRRKKGGPEKHGNKFELSGPSRLANCKETLPFGSLRAHSGLERVASQETAQTGGDDAAGRIIEA